MFSGCSAEVEQDAQTALIAPALVPHKATGAPVDFDFSRVLSTPASHAPFAPPPWMHTHGFQDLSRLRLYLVLFFQVLAIVSRLTFNADQLSFADNRTKVRVQYYWLKLQNHGKCEPFFSHTAGGVDSLSSARSLSRKALSCSTLGKTVR